MTYSSILWPRMIAKSFVNPLHSIRHITSLADAFPVLCCLLLSAQLATAGSTGPMQAKLGGTDHYYCTSNDTSQNTIYFSAEFDFSWPPGTVRVKDSVIGDEFKQALASKYGYQGPVVCFGTKTTAQTQAQLQNGISGARSSGKWTVVETGWKWSGATGATAGAQPATAATSSPDSSAGGESGYAPGGSASSGSTSGGSASGGSMSGGSAQSNSAGQAQNLPAAGTTLAVRILEAVDSTKDPAGKQYRGTVTTAADAGNGLTIPRGAMAMVTLMKSQGGWSAHLQSVMVKGQQVNVTSAPASVMGSAQGSVASAANTVTSALGSFGGFGHKPPKPSGVEAVATGDRVVLPPGTQLQFVISGASAASGGGVPSAMGMPSGGGVPHPGGGGGGAQPAGASSSSSSVSVSGGGQAVSGGALSAKIQETFLGPRKQDGLFVVSPDGGHYAVSAMHGSRELVIVDGVDGPEFDHAAHGWGGATLQVTFSADGKHSCYVGQRGDDLIEVRDGKDAFVITNVHTPTNGSVPPIDSLHQCLMSRSGAHVAVISVASVDADGAGFGNRVFLDGVKGPAFDTLDMKQIAFVGEKLVYAAHTKDQQWHMVVNNVPGPGYAAVLSLTVNQDNNHYAYVVTTVGGQMVVTDGVPGPVRPRFANGVTYLSVASNGRVGYLGFKGETPGHVSGTQVLYVDEKEISSDIRPFAVVDESGRGQILVGYFLFSPDGKRLAYSKEAPGGTAAVIDGKVGRAYDTIGVMQFSPDSKHAFYVGNRTQAFVVVDGQEMEGQGTVRNFVYSKEGGRLGYEAYSAQTGFHMVVDGKVSQAFHELTANTLTFSRDGKHYAYSACTNFSQCQVVEDGVGASVSSLVAFTTRARPQLSFPQIFFSDDGTRMAYAWPKPDSAGNAVVINGQEIMRGHGLFEFPAFSPDSKRFATMTWDGHTYSLSVDGKAGPKYEDFLEVNPNVARFLDSHTFRYLGVKGGMVYRVVVDLGG
jgi:hypothetical protein